MFKRVYHLYKDETYLYQSGKGHTIQEVRIVKGLNNPDLDKVVGEDLGHGCVKSWNWYRVLLMSLSWRLSCLVL
ncbi:MAG: hypothetical protein ACR5LF_10295 [Symbiopectobacterium sp.]